MSDNRRGKVPFQIVSSSVTTGYNAELTAAVGSNLEIVNQHKDEYGGLQDSPMQGPFTEQWVGGNQHRHIDLNSGADDSSNRPEAFLISGSTGKVRVYGPDYLDDKAPKAVLTRDTVSKSPLNIKNIKNENRRLGNFSHNYQVVQTSGRELNQSLLNNDLTASGVLTTKFIEGVEEYSLPEQSGNINKTVFVERFSAPGDRKESSRGALDRQSEQYSPNNSLVTRNIGVRQPFYSQLTQHAAQFNSGSTEGVTIHAINRNTIKNIELSGSSFVTASDYDNFWVQHAIPSTDLRYKWIADSIVESGSLIQYQKPYDSSELVFNSSSFVVSGTNKQFSVDNIGIGSLIKNRKDIDLQTNTYNFSSSVGLSASFSEIANSAYQYPVWKQMRTGEHPIAKKLRNNNIISIEGNKSKVINNVQTQSKRSDSVIGFTDPPVTVKNKPLKQVLELKGSNEKYVFKFSHTNNLGTFANEELVSSLNIGQGSQQIYDLFRKYYSDPNRANNPENPVSKLHSYAFSETLYPKEVNTYLAETRARTAYILTQSGFTRDGYDRQLGTQRAFWRDNLEDRKRSETGFYNSMNYLVKDNYITQSVTGTGSWVTTFSTSSTLPFSVKYDYRQTRNSSSAENKSFKTNDNNLNNKSEIYNNSITSYELFSTTDPGGTGLLFYAGKIVQTIDNGCSGELMNETFLDNYSFKRSVFGGLTNATQLSRVVPNCVLNQYDNRNYTSGSYYSYGSFLTDSLGFPTNPPLPRPNYIAFIGGFESGSRNNTDGEFDITGYDFFNQKPTEPILSTLDSGLRYSTESYGDKKPWFDTYEDYIDDIKALAKEHSIIPEFRISSNMPYYITDKGGNFRSPNKAFLEIDGIGQNYRSAIMPQLEVYDQSFINSYVTTDVAVNSANLQNDNRLVTNLESIKFTISGIKKLLPYNGFYPQERTIQLANLFNDFLEQNVAGGYAKVYTFEATPEDGPGISFIQNWNPNGSELIINITESSGIFAKNSALPYFFSPGILYNTIKSGISVGFPAIIISDELIIEENPSVEMSSITVKTKNLTQIKDKLVSNSYTDNVSILADKAINTTFNFESLIFPQDRIPINTTITGNVHFTSSVSGTVYSLAQELLSGVLINIKIDCQAHPDRSLAYIQYSDIFGAGWKNTIPFCYLKKDSIINPSYSMAMSNFLAEIPTFFLKQQTAGRQQHLNVFRSSELKDWKPFQVGKKYYLDIKMKKSSDLVMIESYRSDYHVTGNNPIEKTFNGRYFGWPVSKISGSNSSSYDDYVIHNDPAYAPFTPPYFEGEAILRFELSATTASYNTVGDLFNDLRLIDIFNELGQSAHTSSEAYLKKMSIQDCMEVFGIGGNPVPTFGANGQTATQDKTPNTQTQYWAISPKIETPVLDFSDQEFVTHTGSYWISSGYGRGMWSGYGKIPTGSKGITIEIAESFPLQNSGKFNNFTNPTDLKLTGSLLEQVGFRAQTSKIGQIADKKVISEAVVMIPYVDQPISGVTTFIDGHHFFTINPFIFDSQKRRVDNNNVENGETSITRLIRLMRQYVIPPNFDFLTYYKDPTIRTIRDNRDGIDPFVMYMFEFTHELDQQDLADIWQGVMPKIAITAEKDEVTFGHKIGENELFDANFIPPPNMRWMVFKVKKKAEWNYFAITENIADDNRFQFNFANSEVAKTPEYSYNWPYDYFSLVELAKVDVTYEYKEKPETTGSVDIGLDTNRFAIGNIADFTDIGKSESINGKDPKRQLASNFINKQNKTRRAKTPKL